MSTGLAWINLPGDAHDHGISQVRPFFNRDGPARINHPSTVLGNPDNADEVDLWLTGKWDMVKHRRRPLSGNMLVAVESPARLGGDLLFRGNGVWRPKMPVSSSPPAWLPLARSACRCCRGEMS